jgi:hypothetical protein
MLIIASDWLGKRLLMISYFGCFDGSSAPKRCSENMKTYKKKNTVLNLCFDFF